MLLAGATPSQLAAAEAELAAAQAGVTLAAGQMLEVQAAIDVASAQVNAAQQQYNDLASHPSEAERTAAVARVEVAEAGLEHAQAAYNLVRWRPDIGALPESLALRQMTAAYEAAKAEAALTTQGPTSQQLAVAASAVQTARAQVQAAEAQAPGAEAAVTAALARQESAQAALDNLRAGAMPEELAMANARLQSAQAMLASAQAQFRQSQIFAPFDGQIGAVNGRVGELATPGSYLVLLGNTRQMHVKTTDLRETDVVRLSPGMAVEVTFDALPDRIFTGEIARIAPTSTAEKGSTNYTVQVVVSDLDSQLRWGMTAFVNIQTRGASP
jgi:multidrug resistance efflux pump